MSRKINKNFRISRLERLKADLLEKYSGNHFAIKALDNRILKIKLFWWVGV